MYYKVKGFCGIIRDPIDPRTLSKENQERFKKQNRKFITRNSACLCGTGKRFKNCCGSARKAGVA